MSFAEFEAVLGRIRLGNGSWVLGMAEALISPGFSSSAVNVISGPSLWFDVKFWRHKMLRPETAPRVSSVDTGWSQLYHGNNRQIKSQDTGLVQGSLDPVGASPQIS